MKTLFKIVIAVAVLVSFNLTFAGESGGHHPLVKHNMVLYGENEIFVSHLVYKAPHNFQVILEIQFPESIRGLYLESKKAFPGDSFIFLLDKMHIADIKTVDFIAGTMTRTNDEGVKIVLAENVRIDKANYKIVFFNELPLNLE